VSFGNAVKRLPADATLATPPHRFRLDSADGPLVPRVELAQPDGLVAVERVDEPIGDVMHQLPAWRRDLLSSFPRFGRDGQPLPWL